MGCLVLTVVINRCLQQMRMDERKKTFQRASRLFQTVGFVNGRLFWRHFDGSNKTKKAKNETGCMGTANGQPFQKTGTNNLSHLGATPLAKLHPP
ncbi:hypothetical protein M0802_012172 [Mischocyttarus mexicanus]|nr:hypothetical protein M0802_012172 [Mischocyttarus mexicanus]